MILAAKVGTAINEEEARYGEQNAQKNVMSYCKKRFGFLVPISVREMLEQAGFSSFGNFCIPRFSGLDAVTKVPVVWIGSKSSDHGFRWMLRLLGNSGCFPGWIKTWTVFKAPKSSLGDALGNQHFPINKVILEDSLAKQCVTPHIVNCRRLFVTAEWSPRIGDSINSCS